MSVLEVSALMPKAPMPALNEDVFVVVLWAWSGSLRKTECVCWIRLPSAIVKLSARPAWVPNTPDSLPNPSAPTSTGSPMSQDRCDRGRRALGCGNQARAHCGRIATGAPKP